MFVAGGFDGHNCLFSVEVYDPVFDQWTVLSPMSTRRSGVSLVSCDDKVYAIGGYDGARRLDTGLQREMLLLLFRTLPFQRKYTFIISLFNSLTARKPLYFKACLHLRTSVFVLSIYTVLVYMYFIFFSFVYARQYRIILVAKVNELNTPSLFFFAFYLNWVGETEQEYHI